MMLVYLVQHAEAKQEEEHHERPLNEKGWADIRKVAGYAAAHLNLASTHILHSGKTRTRQTAEVLAEAFPPAPNVRATDGLDPMADPELWAGRLTEDDVDRVLIGHLPHLSKLAALLLCGDEGTPVISFQNAGILCLERGNEGTWAVRWMLVPSIL